MAVPSNFSRWAANPPRPRSGAIIPQYPPRKFTFSETIFGDYCQPPGRGRLRAQPGIREGKSRCSFSEISFSKNFRPDLIHFAPWPGPYTFCPLAPGADDKNFFDPPLFGCQEAGVSVIYRGNRFAGGGAAPEGSQMGLQTRLRHILALFCLLKCENTVKTRFDQIPYYRPS